MITADKLAFLGLIAAAVVAFAWSVAEAIHEIARARATRRELRRAAEEVADLDRSGPDELWGPGGRS